MTNNEEENSDASKTNDSNQPKTTITATENENKLEKEINITSVNK